MTAQHHGILVPNAQPKIDPSLSGWVEQIIGTATLFGKVQDQTEEQLRKEIAQNPGRIVLVSLFPVYLTFCQLCFTQTGPGRISAAPFRYTDTPERAFYSKGRNRPKHVALTAFSFLSEKPDDERRSLIKSIEDFEQALRIADVGIVAGS